MFSYIIKKKENKRNGEDECFTLMDIESRSAASKPFIWTSEHDDFDTREN